MKKEKKDQNQQFLTASYAVRKPTMRKQLALESASEIYSRSTQALFDWCEVNLPTIREEGQVVDKEGMKTGIYKADSVRRALPPLSTLNVPLASAVCEALIADVSGAIASYLSLVDIDPRTQFPNVPDEEQSMEQYEGALQALATLGNDPDEEKELVSMFLRRGERRIRPICYSRARDFTILCRPEEPHELYAWLPLFRGDNTVLPLYTFDGSMINMATGEPFIKRSSTGIVVKLYIPDERQKHWYNERFLLPLQRGTARIKSAKLIRRKEQWRLNVSVCMDAPPPYEPKTYVGISVGTLEKIGYTVVDLRGAVIKEHIDEAGIYSLTTNTRRSITRRQQKGRHVNASHYKGRSRDEILHHIADKIIEVAILHKSQIVLEDFSDNPGANYRISTKKKLSQLLSPWRKFEFIISYKANLAGVPVRSNMWSALATSICPYCGAKCRYVENTYKQVVECVSCLVRKDKRIVASINLARRMNYRKKDWVHRGGYENFHRQLAYEISQLRPVS